MDRELLDRLLALAGKKGMVDPSAGSGGDDRTVDLRALGAAELGALTLELLQPDEDAGEAPPVDRTAAADVPAALAGWDRYRVEELLGSGGMGEVYRAWDPQLRRWVALKLLLSSAPEQLRRFTREAQAQAQVEHDNVCRIYEVGEVAGRPFIAMQLIRGNSLDRAAEGLGLEEKVAVMRQVVDGVHTAHRHGLVHRDLKPTNVMVEEDDSGRPHPYVLDFGLALPVDADGLTQTGAIAGTPAYMAPEQVHGNARLLDRRTDVYSLGATLYTILGGRPPHTGDNTLELILRVVDEEPPRLREHAPAVPRDLETIVMKCLEKEPGRRYDSARALADDLQRFLDGEPVLARRASAGYRLGRWVRRHKALAAVVAVSTVLVLLLAGLGMRLAWMAERQADTARRFGQAVESIEAVVRFERMLPAHDSRGVIDRVRRQMEEIEEQMGGLGRAGLGPGNYALGRGTLVLGDPVASAGRLQAAWDGGYQTPEVAAALGMAHAERYRLAVADANKIGDEAAREARLAALRSTMRDPAVAWLRLGTGASGVAPALVEARLAMLEERWDEAIAAAQRAIERLPWLYEALIVEGDVYHTQAELRHREGRHEEAEAGFTAADHAFARATDMARSDVLAHTRRIALWASVMRLREDTGGDPEPAYRRALAAAELARTVDPGFAGTLISQADAEQLWAEHLIRRGEDPGEVLERAFALAIEAERLEPDNELACHTAGSAFVVAALYAFTTGQDPTPHLERALEHFERAVELHPSRAHSWQNMGNVHVYTGQYLSRTGGDPFAAYNRALDCYRRSLEASPGVAAVHSNMGLVYSYLGNGTQDRGGNPVSFYEQAIDALDEATRINPNFVNAFINLADVAATLGDYHGQVGENPVADLERARAAAERAIAIKPDSSLARLNLGKSYLHLVEHRVRRGEDPTAEFEQGMAAYRGSLQINPNDALTYLHMGIIELRMADFERNRGRDPRPALRPAMADLDHCARLNSAWVYPFTFKAKAHVVAASWMVESGRDPRPDLEVARQHLERAHQIHPGFAEAASILGFTHVLEAHWLTDRGRSPAAAVEAARAALRDLPPEAAGYGVAAMVRALTWEEDGRGRELAGDSPEEAWDRARATLAELIRVSPGASDANLAMARVCRRQASWRTARGGEPAEAIEAGLEAADRALAASPGDAWCLAERAALVAMVAAREDDPGARDGLHRQAVAALDRAASINPLVESEYRPLVERR